MSDTEKNIAPPIYEENGRVHYTVTTIAKDKNTRVTIYKIPDRIIPVIFLPGVMGSNLMDKEGISVWLANSKWGMKSWVATGPAKRKELLDPVNTAVDSIGDVEAESEIERKLFQSREKRGWGEVAAMSYGSFLCWLQEALNDHQVLINNRTTENGKLTLREQLINRSLHAEYGECPLTRDEVKLSYKYLFPVHAVGYNWLQSNADSAKRLSAKIDQIIDDYVSTGRKCEKVILVTHSMGGLVARHYSEVLAGDNGNKKVLGMVHGVMPDKGAPITYKRMKAGEAGITGLVIGSNGAEMTAVLAQAPGPLQLLPGISYGMGWLKIDGMEQPLSQADPYEEIYTNRTAWWGLCEERFLNPLNKSRNKEQLDKDWNGFKKIIINSVKDFVEDLNGKYHKHTYAFYGNDGKKNPSYASLHWREVTTNESLAKYNVYPDTEGRLFYPESQYNHAAGDSEGRQFLSADIFNKTTRLAAMMTEKTGNIYRRYELQPAKDPGDSTVPLFAAVIHSPHLQAQTGLSVDHEGAFKDDNTMDAHWFTLRSVLKIAQQVNNTGLTYVK